jgi:hypothetical protein
VKCEQDISDQGQANKVAKRTKPCNLRAEFHCFDCDRWYCSQHWYGRMERHADHGPQGRN